MSTSDQDTAPPEGAHSEATQAHLPPAEVTLPHTVSRRHRRRRPTGAAPPLPRSIGATGKGLLITTGFLLVWVFGVAEWEWARRATDRFDAAVLRAFAGVRTGWLTDVMSGVQRMGSGWWVSVVAAGLILALLIFKRWRHVFTLIGAIALLEIVGGLVYEGFSRPRPFDVAIIGRWGGFSMPAAPVAVVTFIGLAIAYGLVVAGRPRTIAKAVLAAVVAVFAVAELYLAVYHLTDILFGVALAVAFVVVAFRFFTPNDVFPVTYRGGKTAHLDVGGRRGEALRQAVQDQLGITVVDVKPFGLAGSGGSTPLRLRVAGDPDTYLFSKLYAMSHVRSDRWYKLGRTILYGRMEDEAPFQSVRRLVQYEDYAARLMRDVGVPTAAPFGIVEMTPEREYLLVTEFFDGAKEIGETDIDEAIIDEALTIIRRLWDAGLAHRDIKPANLLVKDGHVKLIDVAFVQVRPSPWRQAVDLANMMLVLAVRTDAETVYQRALLLFTPDEIAEAFAAARGVASPTQLRTFLKSDGRDLLAEFRALAPDRRPIGLQRWGLRRVVLALAVLAIGVFAVGNTLSMLTPAHDLGTFGSPDCDTGEVMILMAQAVPSATSVPCIDSLPGGWDLGGAHVGRNRATFWLDSDLGGHRAVEVALRRADDCDLAGAVEVPSDAVGMRRYEKPEQLPPNLRSTRYYVFDGGCVTYRFAFDGPVTAALMFDVDRALSFLPREELVQAVHDRNGLRLCGAGAPPCVGAVPVSAPILARPLLDVAGRIVLGTGIAVVTTSVSLRLLGTRRGWAKSLVAGLVGWGIAGVLALSLAQWDWGADGLLIQTLAIGVPATMAVAVGLDLLARPGTLATGELAGLVVAPRPSGRSRPGWPCCAGTGSSSSSPAGRASGPSCRRAPAPAWSTTPPVSACGGCSRRPAASTSNSGRSPPPVSTCYLPTSAPSCPSSRTGSRRSRSM